MMEMIFPLINDEGEATNCAYHKVPLVDDMGRCPICSKEFDLEAHEIIRMVSSDLYGREYLGFDRRYKRLVTIKRLPERIFFEPNKSPSVKDLVQKQLLHPFIVRVYSYIFRPNIHVITMEFVEGLSGISIIRRIGPVPAPKALLICIQVAKALEYAHSQGIYHGLLSLSQIKVSNSGTVKITGFDYSRLKERMEGKERQQLDTYVDIKLLGVLLYQFITGRIIDPDAEIVDPKNYYPFIPEELVQMTFRLINPRENNIESMTTVCKELELIAQRCETWHP